MNDLVKTHVPILDFLRWYKGPDRFYHNLDHINECLGHFNKVKHILMNPEAVWKAIWFHDAIYSTLPNARNEELSATEARKFCKDEEEKRMVTNLILVTKHSDKYPPLTADECFMADIDLASLGVHPDQYDINSANIRAEYRRYDDKIYNQGRIEILSGFLERTVTGKLYYTSYFKDQYNEQAAMNLAKEIGRLKNELLLAAQNEAV